MRGQREYEARPIVAELRLQLLAQGAGDVIVDGQRVAEVRDAKRVCRLAGALDGQPSRKPSSACRLQTAPSSTHGSSSVAGGGAARFGAAAAVAIAPRSHIQHAKRIHAHHARGRSITVRSLVSRPWGDYRT